MSIADLFVFLRLKKRLPRFLNGNPGSPRDLQKFPRIIYIYWDSGLENAPEITRTCAQSWIRMNPGWQVRLLDKETARRLVDMPTLPTEIRPAHYADILRTALLRQHGGVWADATAYCHRPLDDWLPMVMTQTDFFAYTRPAADRVIANWFLAARPETLLISAWHDRTVGYWKTRKKPPTSYFWHHSLFELMLIGSIKLRREWAQAPNISAAAPHLLQKLCAGTLDKTDETMILIQATPVHKLTYKRNIRPEQVQLFLGSLDSERRVVETGIPV